MACLNSPIWLVCSTFRRRHVLELSTTFQTPTARACGIRFVAIGRLDISFLLCHLPTRWTASSLLKRRMRTNKRQNWFLNDFRKFAALLGLCQLNLSFFQPVEHFRRQSIFRVNDYASSKIDKAQTTEAVFLAVPITIRRHTAHCEDQLLLLTADAAWKAERYVTYISTGYDFAVRYVTNKTLSDSRLIGNRHWSS